MITFISVLSVIALIYLYLIYNVSSLRKKPKKYSLDVISKDPIGETIMLKLADGSEVRTVSAGSGPTIVLAHGYASSIIEWNIIFNQLVEEGYHVITFDQIGHGQSTIGSNGISSESMSAAYIAVLEHYNVLDGVLVGHSMGGFLSIVTMLNNSELVSKRIKSAMIMASFAGDVLKNNAQNKLQIPLISSGLMDRIVSTDLLGYPFATTLMGDDPDTAMIDVFLRDFRNTNHKPLVPILKAFGSESYYDQLNVISIPCTIIVGTKDKTTPAFHTKDMATSIPNSKVVKLEGKGHFLNWEAAQEVIDEIKLLAAKPVNKMV